MDVMVFETLDTLLKSGKPLLIMDKELIGKDMNSSDAKKRWTIKWNGKCSLFDSIEKNAIFIEWTHETSVQLELFKVDGVKHSAWRTEEMRKIPASGFIYNIHVWCSLRVISFKFSTFDRLEWNSEIEHFVFFLLLIAIYIIECKFFFLISI